MNKTYLLIGLALSLSSSLIGQTIPNDRDNRATFSPAVERKSPYEFMEKAPEVVEAPEVKGTVGVGETINKFLNVSGYISGENFAEHKVFVGNRFYEVDDILELTINESPDQYLYPVMELTIRDISDEYIEFYHSETASLQRLDFNFSPDVQSKPAVGGSLGNGATLKYVGKDEAPIF